MTCAVVNKWHTSPINLKATVDDCSRSTKHTHTEDELWVQSHRQAGEKRKKNKWQMKFSSLHTKSIGMTRMCCKGDEDGGEAITDKRRLKDGRSNRGNRSVRERICTCKGQTKSVQREMKSKMFRLGPKEYPKKEKKQGRPHKSPKELWARQQTRQQTVRRHQEEKEAAAEQQLPSKRQKVNTRWWLWMGEEWWRKEWRSACVNETRSDTGWMKCDQPERRRKEEREWENSWQVNTERSGRERARVCLRVGVSRLRSDGWSSVSCQMVNCFGRQSPIFCFSRLNLLLNVSLHFAV